MAVSEIDVLVAVAQWLWSEKRVWPANFSIARGQGIVVEESKRRLEIALASLEIPEGLEKFRFYSGGGPDITGVSEDAIWKIECKGIGTGKDPTHRNNFDRALASTVSYYDDDVDGWPDHKLIIGLALPNAPVFRRLLKSKVQRPLRRRLHLWVLLFDPDDNSITSIEPNAEYAAM
jgi:hypothetical protein